jgi:hypothetical protein
MSRPDFIRNFVIGAGCCLGMVAVAAIAALAVVNTGGDPRSDIDAATPTAQQMKQALEFMSQGGVNSTSSGGGASSGGGGGGGAGASATATPATTPQVSLGGGSSSGTSSQQPATTDSTDTSGATPRATTVAASANQQAAPTPVTFTPPTIVAIQPLGAATPVR